MRRLLLALLPLLALLAGCGEEVKTATITGRVTDEDGLPVRDAKVYTIDAETRTSTNGAYILPGNREEFLAVFAEAQVGNQVYRGRNLVRTVPDTEQVSINITVAAPNRLADIRGTVRDRNGRLLAGASVFAFMDGNLSSARAVTDTNGNYNLRDLISGRDYTVQAGAPGYSNDTDNLVLDPGDSLVLNFTLGTAGFPNLPAVDDLTARAWTSPAITRNSRAWGAYENIKRKWSPTRAVTVAKGRSTFSGAPVEIQLDWTRLEGPDFYGYGIYRARGNGALADYDFYREPLAGTYIDAATDLLPLQNYRYGITALGTSYPDDPDSEGPLSNLVEVETLDDLVLVGTTGSPLTFRWQPGSGAEDYVVYVYDRYPGLGVESIWNNEDNFASGTSKVYDGPNLVRGRTYYYLVLGLANGNTSRTLSEVGEFIY